MEVCKALRILYVEDDEGLRRLFQKLLTRAGCEVSLAKNGQEGLTMLQAVTYDVLLIDQEMPGMTGLDVIRVLKDRGELLPTIMITGEGDERIAVEALKLGADDYVIKDVEGRYLDLMPSVIGKIFTKHRILEAKNAAERARLESEIRYRTLFHHSPLGLLEQDWSAVKRALEDAREAGWTDVQQYLSAHPEVACDLVSKIELIDANRFSIEMFGANSVAELNDQLGIVMSADCWNGAKQDLIALAEGKTLFERETEMLTVKGDSIFVSLRWSIPEEYADTCSRVFVSLTDVTEKREAEVKKEAARELIQRTIDSVPDPILVFGIDFEIRFLNAAARALIDDTSVLEPPCFSCSSDHHCTDSSCVADKGECPLEEVLQTYSPVVRNREFRHKSGESVCYEIIAAPVFGHDGQLMGIMETWRDVTDQKRMEEDLFQARKHESIGMLAGGIAHDFNNILSAILGNISLAKALVPDPEKALQLLEKAESSSWRAKDLVDRLLTFARGGAVRLRPTDVGAIMEETAHMSVQDSTVRCDLRIPDGLWLVDGDGTQLGQVVSNLIINAEQAMPDGGVITVSAENISLNGKRQHGSTQLAEGEYVRLTVHDEGVGIPFENVEKIFDPYFTTKSGGTGLGLATSYSIVKKHRGALVLEPGLGKGATFHVFLPRAQEQTPLGNRSPNVSSHAAYKPDGITRSGTEAAPAPYYEALNETGHSHNPTIQGYMSAQSRRE